MAAGAVKHTRRRSLPASTYRRRAHTGAPRAPPCTDEYCIRCSRCPSRFGQGPGVRMAPVARMFLCGRCRAQVMLCSRCDRGNVYCGPDCATIRRRESLRAAGRRYQQSRQGRFAHAARSRRYRERSRNVTHQGSAAAGPAGLLAPLAVTPPPLPQSPPSAAVIAVALALVSPPRCSRCGAPRAWAVRQGWLRHHRRRAGPATGDDERSLLADDFP